jgi:hypothetical protein
MAFAEQAEALLHFSATDMSRRDRERWASCRRWADLAEGVVAWLHGEIVQTPGHCGPPCEETIPLIPVLTAVNRAGFITDNSQAGDDPEKDAWVCGFVPHRLMRQLRAAIEGTPVILEQYCQGREHHGCRTPKWLFCPLPDNADFWAERCPWLADQIRTAWFVTVADPEPGRDDRLWPVLAGFAGLVRPS